MSPYRLQTFRNSCLNVGPLLKTATGSLINTLITGKLQTENHKFQIRKFIICYLQAAILATGLSIQ